MFQNHDRVQKLSMKIVLEKHTSQVPAEVSAVAQCNWYHWVGQYGYEKFTRLLLVCLFFLILFFYFISFFYVFHFIILFISLIAYIYTY